MQIELSSGSFAEEKVSVPKGTVIWPAEPTICPSLQGFWLEKSLPKKFCVISNVCNEIYTRPYGLYGDYTVQGICAVCLPSFSTTDRP